MAVGDYCLLTEIKARLNITSTNSDAILGQIITAISRKFDEYCGRRFYTVDETRYFSADVDERHINPFSERRFGSLWRIDVDDLVSVDSIEVDMNGDRAYEVTLDPAKDYYLLPVNAALMNPPRPYTTLGVDFINGQGWYFPPWPQAVKIQGQFGFSSTTPDEVHEAALLQAEHLYKRKDAPFGVLSGSDFAYPIKLNEPLDPDVAFLLQELVSLPEKALFV